MADLETKLRAAYGALSAAQVAVEECLELIAEARSRRPEIGPGPAATGDCQHEDLQDATVMGMPPRSYCRKCRSFIGPGGEATPADSV